MKTKKIIIILAVSLAIVSGYVIVENLVDTINQNMFETFSDGYKKGLENVVREIFEQTNDCAITSIWVENETRKIIDFDCVEIRANKP